MRLDQRTIAGLDLAGRRDAIFFDEDLIGFGLRLRASGDRVRKSWVAQYRSNGRTRRVLIGTVEKVTLPDARKAARKILAKVELGGDPQGAKAKMRREAAHTFRAVADTYLDARKPHLRPASLRVARLYLTGPYFRALHPMAVNTVVRSDVAAAVRSITSKHSATTAAAARRHLSSFFGWVIAEGLLGNGANPVDGSHQPDRPTSRDRVLARDELVAVWRACGDDDFGRIVRLLILLGSRRAEVGGMRWSEIDLGAGTWALPAVRSKNRRGHVIALPSLALDILRSVPRGARDHLFGGRSGIGFTDWSKCKQQLDQQIAGAVKPWRLHDIRRNVATGMADIGIEPHHIEAVLNHFGGHRAGVAGVYNRSGYERAVAFALQRWADHVDHLVSGRGLDTVVKLPKLR
jgi:integrase